MRWNPEVRAQSAVDSESVKDERKSHMIVATDACLLLLASGESPIAARVLRNYELPTKKLHQMKDVNDLKMKQGMGVKPWVIRQHMSSCQCYHFHQQLNILQSPIQPLRLLVPTNYPNCYPILLDKLPVESEHGARSSIYDEVKAIVKKKWAKSEEVEVQLTQYQYDGMPEDKRFNGKKALSEASVIVREHTPLTDMFMCLWFNEVVQFTSRDQLSFPYVLWRLKVLENVNVFPVCTRKDLVNSMGHIRKAKPLGS